MPCTLVVRRHAHSHVSAATDSDSPATTRWDSWVVEHARFELPRGRFPAVDALAVSSGQEHAATVPTQLPAIVPEAESEIVLPSQTIEDEVFAAAVENVDSLRECGALRLPPRNNASALVGIGRRSRKKKERTQTRRTRRRKRKKKKAKAKAGTAAGAALVHLPRPTTRAVDAQTQTCQTWQTSPPPPLTPPPIGDDPQCVGLGYYDRLCDRIVRRERLYARARLRAVQVSESPPPPTPPPPVPPPPIPPPPLIQQQRHLNDEAVAMHAHTEVRCLAVPAPRLVVDEMADPSRSLRVPQCAGGIESRA